jgi:uncharacterized membrane protein
MNKNKLKFGGSILSICAPAMVYLILAIIGLLAGAAVNFSLSSMILNLVFIALWVFLLNFLCSSGYTVISWILVVLPLIFMIVLIFIAFSFVKSLPKNKKEHFSDDTDIEDLKKKLELYD